jgi:hypothetical protein
MDLIDKVIDLCIDLFRYKREVSRKLFDDFVEPIHSDFESIHKEYLESFHKYRDLIKSSDEPLNLDNSILDMIKRENLFTAHDRARLIALFKSIHGSKPFTISGVKHFIYRILGYLSIAQKNVLGSEEGIDFIRDQRWRMGLLKELKDIFSDEQMLDKLKRDHALKVLDVLVAEMQVEYSEVTSSYFQLKEELLA